MNKLLISLRSVLGLSAVMLVGACAADGSDPSSAAESDDSVSDQVDATKLSKSDHSEVYDLPEFKGPEESTKGLRNEHFCWLIRPGGEKVCANTGTHTLAFAHTKCAFWVSSAPGIFYKYEMHDGSC
jgi:hypothetical protein